MRNALWVIAVSCVVWCLAAPSSWGHTTSKSRVHIDVDDQGQIEFRIGLNEQDVLDLVNVDLSSEQERATAKEVLTARFNQHLSSWIRFDADDKRCQVRFVQFDEPALRQVEVVGSAACSHLPKELRIDWGLSTGENLDLVAFVTLRAPQGRKHTTVLAKKHPSVRLKVAYPSTTETVKHFGILGVEHILLGWDHLAFLLALVLSVATWRRLLVLVTCFTLAHSVTLALAALDVIRLGGHIVEPVIAASISVAAVTGAVLLLQGKGSAPGLPAKTSTSFVVSCVMAVVFGLMHGLGFAAMLAEALDDAGSVAAPLVAFNVGVEVGQLACVVVGFPLLLKVGASKPGKNVFFALYAVLAAMGAYWLVERVVG